MTNFEHMILSTSSTLKKVFIWLLVFAVLYLAKSILIPLSIGAVLATLFLPTCKWLEKKKVPRGLASFFCLFILLLVIAGIASLLSWQIFGLTKDIDLIKDRLLEAFQYVREYVFNHFNISIERQSKFISDQTPVLSSLLQRFTSSLANIFTYFILMLVYVVMLLFYRGHIKQFLLKLVPVSQKVEMEKIIYNVANVSQQYLVGLSKMIVCLWIMYGIGFSILGVHNALFFAFLCGLLEIVPFIGNITGTSVTVLVAAVQGSSTPVLFGIIVTYGLIQFIQGWVLEPLIVGKQVKINPLFTIIALVVGEFVWGIPEIFLAIPLIAMFKIVCDHFDSLKPLGFLIGETEKPEKDSKLVRKFKSHFPKI